MKHSIILIGHRGAGKSTLGARLAARHSLPFFDLDEVIEARSGSSAAQLVDADEAAFRAMERETLRDLLDAGESRVIAVGGGMQDVPPGVVVVWIDREGWEEVARDSRARLRPEMSFVEEVAWMRETREPRYRDTAHLRVHLERGGNADEAAERLAAQVALLLEAIGSPALAKTWIVAAGANQLERCFADAALFGLAGVELRSDLHAHAPSAEAGPWLASLRTEEEGFFQRCAGAAAFDCDASLIALARLDGLAPRPFIVSAHPKDVDQEYFDAMLAAGEHLLSRHPEWKPFLRYKYAPVVKSWVELRFGHELCRVHMRKGGRASYLPQGRRWEWMRAFRLRALNDLNYASPGAEQQGALPPALSFFFPHAAGPAPETFCGVIGDPVAQSVGDVWHRHLSLALDGGRIGYAKIFVPPDELETALYFLLKLEVHGLSVTAPHKRAVIQSNFVTSPSGLESGNTLTLVDGGWILTDTDRDGMRASLTAIEARGVRPGGVAVFGQGGVLDAVTAVLAERGWGPVHAVSAREGWGPLAHGRVTLVVNAAGPVSTAHEGPPFADAWLDLHYRDIAALPEHAPVYLNGWTFYTAQALEQRAHWGFPTVAPL